MKKQEIENRIETALSSLDHVSRVGPGPFFYTRVLARLSKNDRTLWEKISIFISRPAIAFAVICMVISINTLVIFQTERNAPITEQNGVTSSDDAPELDIIAFYDEENVNMDAQ
jgi:hypothetical protein